MFTLISGYQRPTIQHLTEHVLPLVAVKWHDLGLELMDACVEDERLLLEIKKNYRSSNECCRGMFKLWLDVQAGASWNQLVQALREPSLGLNELSIKVEEMLQPICGGKNITTMCKYVYI